MPNYRNGKIYCLRSHSHPEKVYIGSTTQTLAQRLGCHRASYKAYWNNKFNYVTSFEIIQHQDNYIELIENCPCQSSDELRRREGEIMRATDCINKNIAGRSPRESMKAYAMTAKGKAAQRRASLKFNQKIMTRAKIDKLLDHMIEYDQLHQIA